MRKVLNICFGFFTKKSDTCGFALFSLQSHMCLDQHEGECATPHYPVAEIVSRLVEVIITLIIFSSLGYSYLDHDIRRMDSSIE